MPDTSTQASLLAYQIGLRSWLDSQGVAAQVESIALQGRWDLGETGLLEFTERTFTWYRYATDLDGDAYQGSFTLTPGALTNSGFILDHGEDAPIYSVFLHYTNDRVGGSDHDADRWGLFTVEFSGPDEVYIRNHTTNSHLHGVRMGSD